MSDETSPPSGEKADEPSFLEIIQGREKEILKLLKEKAYLDTLNDLQEELVKLQTWVRNNNLKVVVLFEGRDAAGKGGTIKRFVEYLNPRLCRVVALDKPTDREKNQWYFQRYVAQLPAGGEIAFFDRSWYNRPGVERVMGFCTPEQVETFYRHLPAYEQMLVDSGIHLTKFWFSVTRRSQEKRFSSRQTDPLKVWKLSPVDQEAQDKWDDYSRARDDMLRNTSLPYAPWTVVRSDDKKLARLHAIRFFLSQFNYDGKQEHLLKYDPELVHGPEAEIGRE